MALKKRYQNPTIGDTVELDAFIYNSNLYQDVDEIVEVSIFYLDSAAKTPDNPQGRVLIETIPGAMVQHVSTGNYQLDLFLDPLKYTETGNYIDCWSVIFEPGDTPSELDFYFQIYSDLWYATPIPVVYDFQFYFQPNRIRFGSKKPIEIEVIPNVPRATDLAKYYRNLVIAAKLKVFIALNCTQCVPCEDDLRIIVDGDETQFEEKNRAFYWIDTTQFDCGIYDIWFQLEFGGNTYVSDTNQFQIYN